MHLHLGFQTLLLTLGIVFASALPWVSATLRRNSDTFFLIGTGAMTGLCFGDLIPDLLEVGGHETLWTVFAVWFVYSGFHAWHVRRHAKGHGHGAAVGHDHQHDHDEIGHVHAPDPNSSVGALLFLASIGTHCLVSGILLVVSQDLSQRVALTVFAALLAHKGYEAFSVSSMLLKQPWPRSKTLIALSAYCLCLPAGVLLAWMLEGRITQQSAVFLSSVAVGSLIGCLVSDFLVPSIRQLRTRYHRFAWLALGLVLTQLMMRSM